MRLQLAQEGFLERSLAVLAAAAGKWVVVALLLAWLAEGSVTWISVGAVAALDAAFTVAAAVLLLPWGFALLARTKALRKELL